MSQTQVLPNKFFDKKSEEINFAEVVGFLIMGDIKFEIKGGCNKIGRDPELCSVVLKHKTISKLHSTIECEGINDIFILDNGSTNKTILEKVCLKPHCRYKLEHGNLITFGNISCKFVLSFSIGKSIYQCVSMQNSDINNSTLDGVFNVETQINVPIIDKNRSAIKTGNVFQPYESKNLKLRSDLNNMTLSSATCANNIAISHPTTVNSFSNLKETVHYQINHSGISYNSNIFNMETQNLNVLTSNVKTKNIYQKEINNGTIFNAKNENQISSVINTPSTNSALTIEAGDTTSCLIEKKIFPVLNKQVQESTNLVQDEINAEREKELILSDAKLIQSLEENFYVECNQDAETVEQQNNKNPEYLSLSVVNVPKQLEESNINNDTVQNNDTLKLINPNQIITENVIECNSSSLRKFFTSKLNHEKRLKDNNSPKSSEKEFIVSVESSNVQDIYMNGNKPAISESKEHDSKVFSTPNKEFYEEDSDSFLEITIEKEKNNDFSQNSQVPLPLLKEVYENSFKSPKIQSELREQKDFIRQIDQQPSFAKKNSKIFNNFIEVIDSDGQQKEMKLTETPESTTIPLDCNSKIIEELSPISLTKDFGSFVPDSSDEESTLSDLEVIDDSPYFKREKNSVKITNNYSLKRVVDSDLRERTLIWSPNNTAEISSSDVSKSKLRRNSEGSDLSDSSYVFEINEGNENGDLNLKKETNHYAEDALKCLSFSDSDSCDIIDMTPPKTKMPIKEVDSVKPSSSKNYQKKLIESGQGNFFRCSTDDNKQITDYQNLESNPKTLEETLRKIDLKNVNSIEEKRNHKISEAETYSFPQSTINSLESIFFGNMKDTSNSIHGKRNRNPEKITEFIPNKKSKINFFNTNCFESSVYKRKRSEEKEVLVTCFDCENNQNQIMEKNLFLNQLVSSKIPGTYSEILVKSKTLSSNSSKDSFVNSLKSDKKISPNRGELLNVVLQSEANKKIEKQAELKNQINLNDFEKLSRQNYLKSMIISKTKNEDCLESPCMRIVFTGFDSVSLDRIIKDLGGEKVEDLHLGQVLVADRVRRTVKFLCAIGLSIPITSPQWLLESKKQKRFLNPWHHLLKCEESEEKWNFDLKAALEKSKNHKLLKGFCVFATENVKPPVKDILNIVQCCGGTPLYDRPQVWTKQTIVVSCFEDKQSWPPWKFSFVNIVHYEFILSGVLQQNLDFELYKLR